MKTTVELNDELLRRAKQRAAAEGTTLRNLFEEALQRLLDERDRSTSRFTLRDGRFKGGTGPAPRVDLSNWSAVRESIDEEQWAHLDRR